ncbi:MAG: hypothetical protein ABII09_06580 [Planctomycetota bacterium]
MVTKAMRWLWYLSVIAALCLVGVIFNPSIVYSNYLYIVCGYAVVEFLILAIVLSIFRKLDILASWKIIAFHAVIVAGSFFINILLSSLAIHIGDPQQRILLLSSVFAVFLLLAFLNFVLSIMTFVISKRKACFVGLSLGLINAFIVFATTTFCR